MLPLLALMPELLVPGLTVNKVGTWLHWIRQSMGRGVRARMFNSRRIAGLM